MFLSYSGMLQVGIILTTIIALKGCFARDVIANDDGNSTVPILVEYVLLQDKHPCNRTCIEGEHPRICKYDFVVEWYQTMSKACYSCPYNLDDCNRPDCITGDGRKRPIIVVNRQMPGPSIEVCLGDEVLVNVQNHLMVESTSIHWHGQHQVNTPYMDGVPFVTQCPILPSNSFTYRFRPANVGTHFWHSHSGMQRADGAYGSLIVRQPKGQDPHRKLYDRDLSSHTIMIIDWTEETGMNKFIAHHHSTGDNKPSTLLVNGKGRYLEFKEQNANYSDTLIRYTPVERFYVEEGLRYRFRLINAGVLNCPIEFSVDNHTLLVISTDGNDIEAIEAESIVTYAGERFDFIINANQSSGLYWMRFKGLMDCDERFTKSFQSAILQYSDTSDYDYPDDDVPTYETSHKDGLQINPLNVGMEGSNNSDVISMPLLKSIQGCDKSLNETVDFQYFVSYDFYGKDNPMFHKENVYGFHNISEVAQQRPTPQLNNITMKLLPFPMLSERSHLKSEMFCNESTIKTMNCSKGFCECTHVVQIPLGAVVEMILIDTGFAYDANHPFHIHGHSFRVVGMERLGRSVTTDKILKLESRNLLKRNLNNPPIKDTVTVPDGGYTIIRFVASNPGYWFFHCHLEFHVEIGMGLVFKVGEDSDMVPVPKDFPRCGNYNDSQQGSLFDHLWAALFNNSSNVNKIQISTLILTLILLIVSR